MTPVMPSRLKSLLFSVVVVVIIAMFGVVPAHALAPGWVGGDTVPVQTRYNHDNNHQTPDLELTGTMSLKWIKAPVYLSNPTAYTLEARINVDGTTMSSVRANFVYGTVTNNVCTPSGITPNIYLHVSSNRAAATTYTYNAPVTGTTSTKFCHVRVDYTPHGTNDTKSIYWYPEGHADYQSNIITTKPDVVNGACRLTPTQLAGLARGSGIPESEVVTAVAVALAESGGVVNALNQNVGGTAPGSWDIGLWQINDYWHSYERNRLGVDPSYNASAMKEIFSNSGWNAWSAYKSGVYSKHVPLARTGVQDSNGISLLITSCKAPDGRAIGTPTENGGEGNDKNIEGCPPDANFINIISGYIVYKGVQCAVAEAFIPSDDALYNVKQSMKSACGTVPMSLACAGNEWAVTLFDASSLDHNCEAFSINLNDTQIGDVALSPVCSAAKWTQMQPGAETGTMSHGQIYYNTVATLIWIATAFILWHRIARAFGAKTSAKPDTTTEENDGEVDSEGSDDSK